MLHLTPQKRFFYGMGGLTISLSDLIVMQWLLVRYLPPESPPLVNASILGVLIFLGRVAEGISFAVVGHWSDQYQSPHGRRIPFLRAVIIPFVLVFFGLFNPPFATSQGLNTLYAGVFIFLYFGMYGAVVVPYVALIPELTSNLKERVDLTTWQSLFILVSTFIFGMTGFLLKHFGWVPVMGGAALLVFLFFLPVCTRFAESRTNNPSSDHSTLKEAVSLSLKNRAFRLALVPMGIFWFALSGLTTLIPYWVTLYLGYSQNEVVNIMLPYLLISFVSFFVVNRLSIRVGKHKMLLFGYFLSSMLFFGLMLVGYLPFFTEFVQTQLLIALCGIPVAIFTVLAFPLLSDVVDYDELLTGKRNEAIFFGVKGIFQKILIGLSALVFTLISNTSISGLPVIYGLKLMALFCGIASLIAFLIFLRYPLRESHGKIFAIERVVHWRYSPAHLPRPAATIPFQKNISTNVPQADEE